MLHILWLLLKFILIVLGVIAGLLLLFILFALFCPIRYRADVKKETEEWKEINGLVRISWLLHMVSLGVMYQEGKPGFTIRVAGIPVLKVLSFFKKRRNHKKKEDTTKKESESQSIEMENEQPEPERIHSEAEDEQPERIYSEAENEQPEPERIHSETENEQPEPEKPVKNISNKFRGILEKIKDGKEKLSDILSDIKDKKDKVSRQAGWWKKFLTHKKTREALVLLKDSLFRIVRHIFPTKLWGNVTFGSEDPSVTGTVLAALSITLPFHKNVVKLHPVFDGTNVAIGELHLKGRIYGIVFLTALLKLYFNRNIKFVMHTLKKKKEA